LDVCAPVADEYKLAFEAAQASLVSGASGASDDQAAPSETAPAAEPESEKKDDESATVPEPADVAPAAESTPAADDDKTEEKHDDPATVPAAAETKEETAADEKKD
jgi:hypothetical protein